MFWDIVLSEYWLVSCLIPWSSETTLWGVWSSLTCQCWTLQFTVSVSLSSGWFCSSGDSCPEGTYWDSSETVGGRSQRQPPEQGVGLSNENVLLQHASAHMAHAHVFGSLGPSDCFTLKNPCPRKNNQYIATISFPYTIDLITRGAQAPTTLRVIRSLSKLDHFSLG